MLRSQNFSFRYDSASFFLFGIREEHFGDPGLAPIDFAAPYVGANRTVGEQMLPLANDKVKR
jgi:hypothetical protein